MSPVADLTALRALGFDQPGDWAVEDIKHLRAAVRDLVAEVEQHSVESATSATSDPTTWAIAAATLNSHADGWEEDGSDPCRVRICREMANAFRSYAEGVGVPSHETLRQRRDEAIAERDEARAALDQGLALHEQSLFGDDHGPFCEAGCSGYWPCATARALAIPDRKEK